MQEATHQSSACAASGTAVCPTTNQEGAIDDRTQEGEATEIRDIKAGWVGVLLFLYVVVVCVDFL